MTDDLVVQFAHLRSVNADGEQVAALRYDFSKPGEGQRMDKYARHETSRGNRVYIEYEYK